MLLEGQTIVITGGTGSLGQTLVRRLLLGEMGLPARIVIFSRDEAKQQSMRCSFGTGFAGGDPSRLVFRIGDVRDYSSVLRVVREADVVIHMAALKQVPSCEYAPYEAVQTNILGTENLVRAIRDTSTAVKTAIAVSTDKACKPVNVMGMSKAIMERLFVEANLDCVHTRWLLVRYGNTIGSRGSVIPLFSEQIARGGPVTITTEEMTRFLITLDRAVDTIFTAIREGLRGETYVPNLKSARLVDIAAVLIDGKNIPVRKIGIRPGEKIHEVMISEEESNRTRQRGDYFVIGPVLSELQSPRSDERVLMSDFSSRDVTLDLAALRRLLSSSTRRLNLQGSELATPHSVE